MARKIRLPSPESETDSPYATDVPSPVVIDQPGGADDVVLVDPAPLIGDAVARERMIEAEVRPARRYELLQGGCFTIRGYRTTLRSGKIVTEANYDVDALRSQGAVLREVG